MDLINFENQNLIFVFATVFVGGFLTSLTPCIFPMIPITLSVLGARTQGQSRRKSFLISCVYVLGIALVYSLLGLLAAKTGALFGSLLSKPSVVIGIAIVFYLMALSMLGVYEIQVPTKFQTKLNKIRFEQNYFGAFLYGAIAGMVASPCVGPVLVGLLTYVAKLSQPILGFALLFTYALGLGIIFLILGTSTQLLNKLPKSGPWMNFVKFVFGTSMMAVALYYIKNAFPQKIFLIAVGLTLVLVASLFGALDDPRKVHGWLKIRKWVMSGLFISGIVLSIGALTQRQQTTSTSNWKSYNAIEFEAALKSGKPTLLDFFAEWCAACHELEKNTFSNPSVKQRFSNYNLFRLDATTETDEIAEILKKFNVVGLPTVQFFNSKGEARTDLTLTGFEDAEKFNQRLDSLER